MIKSDVMSVKALWYGKERFGLETQMNRNDIIGNDKVKELLIQGLS